MIHPFNSSDPSHQIVALLSIIYKKSLTTSSGGNISIKDKQGNIYITPSYIDKGELSPEDICIITSDNKIKGIHPPSSELSFHREIYKVRSDIYCIIHAHPPALVSFSLRNKIPNSNLIYTSHFKSEQSIFSKYEIPGSEALSLELADKFNAGYNSVIMENHGAVSGGSNPLETLARFESLEFLAESEINANILSSKLSTPNFINATDLNITTQVIKINRAYKGSKTGRELSKYISRAYFRNLIFNNYTSFSARENESDFLINNKANPFWESNEENLLWLILNEKTNDLFIEIHRLVYQNRNKINSILIGQPSGLMAYSITKKTPVSVTIPESYIFLKDSISISSKNLSDIPQIISEMSNNYNLIIVENMFVISFGESVFETFNRMEVGEFNAKSILADYTSASINLLNKKQIEDLDKKYF